MTLRLRPVPHVAAAALLMTVVGCTGGPESGQDQPASSKQPTLLPEAEEVVVSRSVIRRKSNSDGDVAPAPTQPATAPTNERIVFSGKTALFGNLHAHSMLSDDVKNPPPGMSPLEGYTTAHDNGLDFLVITDHHKAVNSKNRLWLEEDEYRDQLYAVADSYTREAAGSFIAIAGMEWGNTATGNHMNLVGARQVPPDSIKDADYNKIVAWARQNAAFIQLNHPHSWKAESKRNKSVGNFGAALYADDAAYVRACGDVFRTMTIIATVAGGHISGGHKHSQERTHRDVHGKHLSVYLDYLNMGFHLAPSANQDTHWNNWGVVTAARTVAWADSATYDGLMAAFKAGRVYATEDDELIVAFQVRRDGSTYWMGDTVPLEANSEEVKVRVYVDQRKNTEDGREIDEGPYTVELWSDSDGPDGKRATLWASYSGIAGGKVREISVDVVKGEYIFLRVIEENGQDNPVGDGEDEYDNSTGEHDRDGQRDDMNDEAWTAPIWFE